MDLNNKLYNYFVEQKRTKKEIEKSEAIASDLIKWMDKTNKEVKK